MAIIYPFQRRAFFFKFKNVAAIMEIHSFVRIFHIFLRVIWNVEHSCDNYFGRNKIFSSSFQTHGHFPMYMLEIIYSFWFYDVFFWLWIINNSLNASQSPKLGKKTMQFCDTATNYIKFAWFSLSFSHLPEGKRFVE